MPNIKKVKVESNIVMGLQVRTKNVDEMNQETRKIAPLWGKFFAEVMPTLEPTPTALYGVYHHYESDAQGEYDLLVGVQEQIEGSTSVSVSIEAGHYLVFPAQGKLPNSIMDAWQRVWAYFDDPSIDERRAYGTDFEKYISDTEAEIYIGVDYL
jgi:predicted transcriptional regulator YdeE